jgi:cobalt-precorrin-5B (C1)-methyltransferase
VHAMASAAGIGLADEVARRAGAAAQRLAGPAVRVEILIVDRTGAIVGGSI